jgi:hypothetical protein
MDPGAVAGTTANVLMRIFKTANPVIASAAKQSSSRQAKGLDCFASLAMTRQESAFSQRHAPEVCQEILAPSKDRGRRECRMLDAPAASRAKKEKRTRTYKVHRKQTAFPAQWF